MECLDILDTLTLKAIIDGDNSYLRFERSHILDWVNKTLGDGEIGEGAAVLQPSPPGKEELRRMIKTSNGEESC
jgi:hypothetical protein